MAVGALRDVGVPEAVFQEAVAALGLGDEMHLHFSWDARQGIAGWRFHVHTHAATDHGHLHSHGHSHSHSHGRTWREIRTLLEESFLHPTVKARAVAVFERIAVAEAKIHGLPVADVGFHEVGAVDSIADIVAACAGFHWLGPLRVEASALVEGSGWITCDHGKFPLPAPATLEILKGIPLRQVDEPGEFITPTGAALVAEFAERFGPMATMRIATTGFGVGTRDTRPRPNVLRAVLGEADGSAESDEIAQIETNLDDTTPEIAGEAMKQLFEAGALDVFFTPVQMKKNRPGFVLTVLCAPELVEKMARVIFTQTSSFGMRVHRTGRVKLRREIRDVATVFGPVQVKLGFLGAELIQSTPEFECCRLLAEKCGVSVRDVYHAVPRPL